MGEILRAVLDASCVYTNPNFYVLSATSSNTGVQQTLTMTLQTKRDTYFMVNGIFQFATFNSGASGKWLETLGGSIGGDLGFMKLYNPMTGERFFPSIDPTSSMPYGLINDRMNTGMTLPEYFLLEPGQIISADIVSVNTSAITYFVVLSGIEYKQ